MFQIINKFLIKKTLQNNIIFRFQNTIQLTDLKQWSSEVIESPIPVVLDCYADWCDPCKKLTPILEKQAQNSKGKWKLVKVNIEKFPEIAQGLQIKSIPAVFLVQNQQAVDGFIGFPDEKILNQFFKNVEMISSMIPIDDEVREKVALALTFIQNDIYIEESLKLIQQLKENKDYEKNHSKKFNSLLAFIYAKLGNKNESLQYLNKIKNDDDLDSFDNQIIQLTEKTLQELSEKISNNFPELVNMQKLIQQDPQNLQLVYELAAFQNEKSLYEDSIQNLFKIIQSDKNWQDKKAIKLLNQVFAKLGSSHQLTIDGRKRLQKLLF